MAEDRLDSGSWWTRLLYSVSSAWNSSIRRVSLRESTTKKVPSNRTKSTAPGTPISSAEDFHTKQVGSRGETRLPGTE